VLTLITHNSISIIITLCAFTALQLYHYFSYKKPQKIISHLSAFFVPMAFSQDQQFMYFFFNSFGDMLSSAGEHPLLCHPYC